MGAPLTPGEEGPKREPNWREADGAIVAGPGETRVGHRPRAGGRRDGETAGAGVAQGHNKELFAVVRWFKLTPSAAAAAAAP